MSRRARRPRMVRVQPTLADVTIEQRHGKEGDPPTTVSGTAVAVALSLAQHRWKPDLAAILDPADIHERMIWIRGVAEGLTDGRLEPTEELLHMLFHSIDETALRLELLKTTTITGVGDQIVSGRHDVKVVMEGRV